ncbi:SWI/SNF and RSC complex subunit Ssr2 [Recurvomyces mirabilis]|uniref:SWI/SNF and RSC complex subunit Ssr2 n=1 Tax=Recurvomyces mirabilis TaxID=574656 RepID=A0AAE0WFP0_9PEZI|nr:SWI/SNF and RSC complex subunit Ssr2 [Recurvomyces mirabilis]KAK5156237.1 hypothetical protein LTS14_005124 [Recurvomyces mirabilis]
MAPFGFGGGQWSDWNPFSNNTRQPPQGQRRPQPYDEQFVPQQLPAATQYSDSPNRQLMDRNTLNAANFDNQNTPPIGPSKRNNGPYGDVIYNSSTHGYNSHNLDVFGQGAVNPSIRPPTTINPQHLHHYPSQYVQQPSIQHARRERTPEQNLYQAPQTYAHPQQQHIPQVYNLTSLGPAQSRKPARLTTPPRQASKPISPSTPTSAQSSTPNVVTPRWHARDLLPGRGVNAAGPTSAALTQGVAKDNQSATGEAQDQEDVGMSHFLGNIHRITNRGEAPQQRKRKTESNGDEEGSPEPKKSKSTFHGIASGGQLGRQLKEDREKKAAESGPAAGAIDLTNDDEELVVTGEKKIPERGNDDKEICLGVIQGKASISRIPNYSTKACKAIGDESWPMTKVEYRRQPSQNSRIELLDRGGGKVVGFIDMKLASALCPLLDGQSRLRVSIRLQPWKRTKHAHTPGQAVSEYVNIIVILHCPRRFGLQIGKFLSQRQIFLNTPASAGIYVGSEIDVPGLRPTGMGPGAGDRRPQTQAIVKGRTQEEMTREAEVLFDKIRHDDLPRRQANEDFIKQPLMDHQQQALSFLYDHETYNDDDKIDDSAFSLWKPNVNHRGDRTWVHHITDQEIRHKPKPVKGGILADMMGLGKTLSILALIAETEAQAEVFGETGAPAELEGVERNARTTLIICPKSVMSNWEEQIRAHVKRDMFSWYFYHGSKRSRDIDELAEYDIILTTYDTVAADSKSKAGTLGAINWFRIVLDEAHTIRNQTTYQAKACIELLADRRWAVTGTPVQNGLNDLAALIKFLRVEPFSDTQSWNQYILSPLKSGNANAIAHLRLLVDGITLRRMKDKIGLPHRNEYEVVLTLPDEERKIYERIASQSSQQMSLMTGGHTHRMKGKAYAHMLRLIDRMRRFCAHGLDMFNDEDRKEIEEGMNADNAISIIDLGDDPTLGPYEFISPKAALEHLQLMIESNNDQCDRCGEILLDQDDKDQLEGDSDEEGDSDDLIGHLTSCFHLLCRQCKTPYIQDAEKTMTADKRHTCVLCQQYQRFGLFDYYRSALRDHIEDKRQSVKKRRQRAEQRMENYEKPSIKVQCLIEDLRKAEEETNRLPPDEPPIRSVVFSQWTSYLDLIELALIEEGIGFVRLDGTMTVKQRSAVLTQFKTLATTTVILVSIKAGGQGLNFTQANHVYMMEPQYNPGVEQQAIDRVHRLGQKREVFISHYLIKDSIEQKIQVLQKRKEDLARLTLERKMDKAEKAKQRIDDLKDLFR